MILVTGATGLLGSQVVRTLRRAGADVRTLVRMGSEYYWLNDTGCTYFFGDLRTPSTLKRALKGCDRVIHAARVTRETTDNNHEVTTLKGSRDLIDLAAASGVEHFVLASCMGAGGDYPVPAFHALRQVEEHLQASGMSHTILRFSVFGDELARHVHRVQTRGKAWICASPSDPITPIFRRDAALFAIAALDLPAARDQLIPISGDQTVQLREAMELACRVGEVDADDITWLGRTGSRLAAQGLGMVLGRRWKHHLSQHQVLLGENFRAEMGPIKATFGVPITPFEEAMCLSVEDRHPSLDPDARDNQVVHRQFQATVYAPGETTVEELPQGPLLMD